jgi:hypothetical protein
MVEGEHAGKRLHDRGGFEGLVYHETPPAFARSVPRSSHHRETVR